MIRALAALTPSIAAAFLASASAALPIEDRLAQQRAAYDAETAKNVIDLQLFRYTQKAELSDGTPAQLVALNPNVNAWFLLGIGTEGRQSWFHLENPAPDTQAVSFLPGDGGAALVISDGKRSYRCQPWEGRKSELEQALRADLPFAPICGDRLFLRVQTGGSYTSLEATSQFLRDHIWGGEALVDFVKGTFNKDKYVLGSGDLGTGDGKTAADGPPDALVRFPEGQRPLMAAYHEFDLVGADNGMAAGLWYAVEGHPGVYASAIQPRWVSDEVLRGPGQVNGIDGIEGAATDYFIAFQMDRFELGYARGTDHPRLDWSPRPPWNVRVPGTAGPDGIGDARPLVSLGMVGPYLSDRVEASFTAGFKRQHGAFRGGPLAGVNYGSHYGLIEQGVILSKLWPGLSTVYVLQDGTIGMKTWAEEDNAMLANIRFARQNGTALVENGQPGPYVTQWMAGNWSGSADADLRTLRAGTCMINRAGTRYLVYGYFSTATPSAMTRTFQAYGCDYAMLLDMNALEHTYLGLYTRTGKGIEVDHIVSGMGNLDKSGSNGVIPRFIGYPDNRDVFYLVRKE